VDVDFARECLKAEFVGCAVRVAAIHPSGRIA
jgi:hypothetical protein